MKTVAQGMLWRDIALAGAQVIDGDTLRVRDPDPGAWGALQGRLRLRGDGTLVLRLAGVDAAESHYPGGPPGLQAQPAAAAALATRQLTACLAAAPEARLTVCGLGADRYGRALVLAWTQARTVLAAAAVEAELADSLNAGLLAGGACFPDLWDQMPASWSAQLATIAGQARREGRGLWALDGGQQWFALDDWPALCGQRLILPRLFRRIAEFWRLQAAGDRGRGGAGSSSGSSGGGGGRGASGGGASGAATGTALDDCLREFLEQRECQVRLAGGGPERPFADWVELDQGACRFTGQVENFLYQSCSSGKKLT
ncbi:MAG: hypothetical protein KGI67_13535 [Pseudomonadota bacterium]|nr:hypothetical protein [Pseudomonadota bacterium]